MRHFSRCAWLVCVFWFLPAADAFAQDASLLKDIKATKGSYSYPQDFHDVNGKVIFRAYHHEYGYELWITDGTEAGTELFRDIYPGRDSSSPYFITMFNGEMYFYANDPVHGYELWKTDGTEAGTKLVKDIYPGVGSGSPSLVAIHNGIFLLRANHPDYGSELWKTDGTAEGTVLVKDINPEISVYGAPVGSNPYNYGVYDGKLYFRAYTYLTGYELYTTDGTADGTKLVVDIAPGLTESGTPNSSSPSVIAFHDGCFFLAASHPDYGQEMWKFDPVTEQLTFLGDLYPGTYTSGSYSYPYSSSPRFFAVMGGTLYFYARDAEHGQELWKTDGTPAGTVLVADTNPGTANGYFYSPYAVFEDKIVFRGYDTTAGYELWVTDGTEAGTHLLKDLYPGTYTSGNNTYPNNSYPSVLADLGGVLLFTVSSSIPDIGRELFVTDGTAAGTKLLVDLYPGTYTSGSNTYPNSSSPSRVTILDGLLYFTANSSTYGRELFVSDGTAAGTGVFKDIYSGTGSSSPSFIALSDTTAYFRANHPDTGYELWKTDWTPQGTHLVKDSNPGTGNMVGYPSYQSLLGDTLYAALDDGVLGYELWMSDGTEAGTGLVKDIEPSANSHGLNTSYSYYYYLYEVPGRLICYADDGVHGIEPWVSDGTPDGTKMLFDTSEGASGGGTSYFRPLAPLPDGKQLVRIYDADHGYELWMTDGTVAGTVLVKDINPGIGSSSPNYRFTLNDVVYFSANDGVNGTELWRSDGTASGTWMVKDLHPGTYTSNENEYPNSSSVTLLAVDGTKAWLNARDAEGSELWLTDGTAAGTYRVKDIYPGTTTSSSGYVSVNSGNPQYVGLTNGKLLFRAQNGDATLGYELWVSDGTDAGTFLLVDLYPGTYTYTYTSGGNTYTYTYANSSSPANITNHNGLCYFRATTTSGAELWVSNGTLAGTSLVKDIHPGTYVDSYGETRGNSSSPTPFGIFNGLIYFTADDGVHGQELWRTDGTAGGTTLALELNTQTYTYSNGTTYNYPSSISYVAELGGEHFVRANDNYHGYEIWKTGFTPETTTLLKDIYPGTGSGANYVGTYYGLEKAHGVLYFIGYDPEHRNQVWRTDGTPGGTAMVEDVSPRQATYYYYTRILGLAGNTVLFAADDLIHGYELWKIDPTPVISTDIFEPGASTEWAALKPMDFDVRGIYFLENSQLTITGYLDNVELTPTGDGATLSSQVGTNPVKRTFSWVPGEADAGAHTLRFVVTDGTHTAEFHVDVNISYDKDGDGIPDLWETEGYRKAGIFVDLPAIKGIGQTEGADPERPDIYVEIDYMKDADHDMQPFNQAIQWIVQSFAARGIALHVLLDDPVPFSTGIGTDPLTGPYDWAEFDNLKDAYFTLERRPAFRYCLFANELGVDAPKLTSGIARAVPGEDELGASDFIIAMGAWAEGKRTQERQGGTFMHELGHCLGLGHGGGDTSLYKPNYLSVMNYLFQEGLMIDGLTPANKYRMFDYSFYVLPDIDESAVNEYAGLRTFTVKTQGKTVTYTYYDITDLAGYGTRWKYSYATQETTAGQDVNDGISWNLDETLVENIELDLNQNGFSTDIITSFHDWSNLKYTGGLVGGTGLPLPRETVAEELTVEESVEIFGEPPANDYVPVAIATTDAETYLTGEDRLAGVTLDGSGSYDTVTVEGVETPTVEGLSYWWYEGTTLLGNGEILDHRFPAGSHTVSLFVEDGSLRSEPDVVTFLVYASNTTSTKVVRVNATPNVIWPPDKSMVPVKLTILPPTLTLTVVGVVCNEAIRSPMDSTDPDWNFVPTDPTSVLLRADRDGTGADRIYRVDWTATDPADGATYSGSVEIVVPHDQRDHLMPQTSLGATDPTNAATSGSTVPGPTDGMSTDGTSTNGTSTDGASTGETGTDGASTGENPGGGSTGDTDAEESSGDSSSSDDSAGASGPSIPDTTEPSGDGVKEEENSQEQAGDSNGGTEPVGAGNSGPDAQYENAEFPGNL